MEKCNKCGADLLPGDTFKDRIGNTFAGILGGVVAGFVAYLLIAHPEFTESSELCILTQPTAWLFATVAIPISSIALAVKKTLEYLKYQNRAYRHIDKESEQAIADFSKTLELAPEKKHAPILKARGDLYVKLNKEELATKDRLAYTSAEGAF